KPKISKKMIKEAKKGTLSQGRAKFYLFRRNTQNIKERNKGKPREKKQRRNSHGQSRQKRREQEQDEAFANHLQDHVHFQAPFTFLCSLLYNIWGRM
ncbi:MAG: hypothetical protein IKD18_03815, partial [Clostridia bacterium]|nr:hypothetical protein [Clostridia bacterium]